MSPPATTTNRLAHEASPYLRQHQHNPVDWYPWGEEALARARAEDKPILLSIGYSACHWCHVMAHESFEDEATAARLNASFVSVKVDREERPDVDQLYQGVVQMLGRGGGWPLTVFLTPSLEPFFGGTYFPREPRHGLPSFKALLERVAEAWREERSSLEAQAKELTLGLADAMAAGLDGKPGALPTGADLVETARLLARRVDPRHGGFGLHGPKFPNPMLLELLLRGSRRSGEASLRDAALLTLEKMALGGVFDQLGGGFHRYSVDERWAVPHFEKMLYDNAQLLHVYAAANQVAPRPLWREVLESTVEWLTRELRSAQGVFFTAQDADTEGEEGRFFAWTPAHLQVALGAEAALVAEHFGVTDEGNFEGGATVLSNAVSVAELAQRHGLAEETVAARLAAARATLFQLRARRAAPGLDDKVLVGLNGLLLRGLCSAGRALGRREWIELARVAADALVAGAVARDGSVAKSLGEGPRRLEGTLEDAGHLALGLLSVAQATLEPRYVEVAARIARRAAERFWDPERKAWLTAAQGTANLLVPVYALHDNATPSGASSLTEAQVLLTALTGDGAFADRAGEYLARLHDELEASPAAFGHLLLAADALADGAVKLSLHGDLTAALAVQAELDRGYHPTTALERSAPLASGDGRVALIVCRGATCSAPLSSVTEAVAQLGPRG